MIIGRALLSLWKLTLLLFVGVGTLVLIAPPGVEANPPDCVWSMTQCQNSCPFVPPTYTTKDPSCISQCVNNHGACVALGGNDQGGCDALWGACGNINSWGGSGPQIGDCYGTYFQCEYNNHQSSRAMMQQTTGEIPGYNSECMQNVTYNRDQCLAGNNPDCLSSVDGSSIFACCNGQREREAVSCLAP